MKLYTTADITISCADNKIKSLKKLQDELTEVLSEVADSICEKYGLHNEETWAVLVDEIQMEEDDKE